MKLCILGPDPSEKTFEEDALIEEGKKVFESVSYVPIPEVNIVHERGGKTKVLYKNQNLLSFDCVLPRVEFKPPNLSMAYVNFGYAICKVLEGNVYLPVSPEGILLAHNKFLSLLALQDSNHPVPETYLSLNRKNLEGVLDKLSYPVVIKLLYGAYGKGVMFAESRSSAVSVMDTVERMKEPILLEEYIKGGEVDMRLVIVGDQCVAAIKRMASSGERRANIGLGGSGEKFEPKPEIQELAVDAAKSLGLNLAGIDIIREKKPKVIEVNGCMSFEGATKATGVNVAREVVEWMRLDAEKWYAKKR